jgi:L-methionine (R)-S-oxide reductase
VFPVNEIHQAFLETLLRNVDGVAGTVHEQRGEDLYLTAAQNIPPPVLAIVTHVPRGKGMAGVAQVSKQPVQTCNLQTDDSDTIKPGAKAVNAQAAIAVPVLDEDGGVRAVVGVAWADERELDSEFEKSMMQLAAALPRTE